jgi:hypothetical protein
VEELVGSPNLPNIKISKGSAIKETMQPGGLLWLQNPAIRKAFRITTEA